MCFFHSFMLIRKEEWTSVKPMFWFTWSTSRPTVFWMWRGKWPISNLIKILILYCIDWLIRLIDWLSEWFRWSMRIKSSWGICSETIMFLTFSPPWPHVHLMTSLRYRCVRLSAQIYKLRNTVVWYMTNSSKSLSDGYYHLGSFTLPCGHVVYPDELVLPHSVSVLSRSLRK